MQGKSGIIYDTKHDTYIAKHVQKWFSLAFGVMSECQSNKSSSKNTFFQIVISKVFLCKKIHHNYDVFTHSLNTLQKQKGCFNPAWFISMAPLLPNSVHIYKISTTDLQFLTAFNAVRGHENYFLTIKGRLTFSHVASVMPDQS